MAWGESKAWKRGSAHQKLYQSLLDNAMQAPARNSKRRKVLHPEDMPWEMARQGLLKHLLNEQMNTRMETVDAYMQIIPPNTIHQHFNAASDKPVRLISAINRIYKYCGLNDLEQLEDAPEYDAKIVLSAELVEKYLNRRIKEPA